VQDRREDDVLFDGTELTDNLEPHDIDTDSPPANAGYIQQSFFVFISDDPYAFLTEEW